MAHTGTPWTAEEDQLLVQAVAVHGEVDQWKIISSCVPGRTNKACRKRWLHSLSPTIRKTAWTAEEDQALLTLYALHGIKWSLIARSIPGRTDDACSKRYREALDPALRKDDWTVEEDARLLDAYARLGGKWGQIGQEMQRSGLGCRNRWRMMERKRQAASRMSASPSQAVSGPSNYGASDWPLLSSYPDESAWAYGDSLPSLDANLAPYQTIDMGMGAGMMPATFASTSAGTGPMSTSAHPSYFTPPSLGLDMSLAAQLLQQEPSHDVTVTSPAYEPSEPTSAAATNTAMADVRRDEPVATISDSAPPTLPSCDDTVPSPMGSSIPDGDVSTGTSASFNRGNPNHAVDAEPTGVSSESTHCSPAEPLPAPEMSASLALLSMAASAPAPITTAGSSSHYRSTTESRLRNSAAHRRAERSGKPLRLSASLAISTDSSVMPYACGYTRCWPAAAQCSSACFTTSADLSDHAKEHDGEVLEPEGKPYRCALPGCGKSWKSVNGLQYHLQVSKVHFRRALEAANEPVPSATGENHAEASHQENGAKARKTFPCPQPHCPNVYKQLSGLRYHLSRVHPAETPAQINVLPPTLARLVASGRDDTQRDLSVAGN